MENITLPNSTEIVTPVANFTNSTILNTLKNTSVSHPLDFYYNLTHSFFEAGFGNYWVFIIWFVPTVTIAIRTKNPAHIAFVSALTSAGTATLSSSGPIQYLMIFITIISVISAIAYYYYSGTG
ncbi:hypothetical protein ACPB8Q_05035 [Methanocaldococcus indicus]|uniref:hypothetical protein n=1 Tax=Methanocaldococcus indicus TaxID=213231 RepID=UPI003C6DAAF9